jgi:hypothetical protein
VAFAVAAANTAATTADNVGRAWTAVEYRPSTRTTMDGPGRSAHYYGSEGPQTNDVGNHGESAVASYLHGR